MRILIVEDESPIAEYIEKSCRAILGPKIQSIKIIYELDQASDYLNQNKIDLLLLDLNLHGENGYELLKSAVAGSFHTIIISAYTNQAIEAFEYGVLDFVPKPFKEERLRYAFDRYFAKDNNRESATKYLTARRGNENIVIPVEKIRYFKSAGIYSEAYLTNGKKELLNKNMNQLIQILPKNLLRIHRTCIVDINQIHSFKHGGGGIYNVILHSGEVLPLNRTKFKELQECFNS
jgi:two-component system, LytTR family, response regulator LytT